MIEILNYIEFTSKLIFGVTISLAFAGVTLKDNKKEYLSLFYALIFVQTFIYIVFGEAFMITVYPIVIHIPIIIFLNKKMKIPLLLSAVCLFFAFQFLSPRQWIGNLFTLFFNNNPIVLSVSTIVLSIPFATIIIRFLAPEVAVFKREDNKVILMIGIVPMFYYLLTYTTVIYSDALEFNHINIVDFLDGSFALIFVLYTICFLKIMQDKKETETEREVLLVMKESSRLELEELHKTQNFIKSYHHDLRHHIKHLDNLILENKNNKAREYLKVILDEQTCDVMYASSESVNMILEKFKKQAENYGVQFEMQVLTNDFSGFDELSLCSLISNGLENAIKFSKEHATPQVYIAMQREERALTILIKNNYEKLPEFRNLRPFTKEYGHGYGTKRMMEVVKKYKGFSQFYVEYNYFIFRATFMSQENDM